MRDKELLSLLKIGRRERYKNENRIENIEKRLDLHSNILLIILVLLLLTNIFVVILLWG